MCAAEMYLIEAEALCKQQVSDESTARNLLYTVNSARDDAYTQTAASGQDMVGAWACDYAESRSPFDEIKHRLTLKEAGDVTEGKYDWKLRICSKDCKDNTSSWQLF